MIVISELRHKYPLRILLKVLKLSKSTYYYAISKTDKDSKDDIMNIIIHIFYTHKERYGYRRITMELHNLGIKINHKKVKRLMKRMGLYGIIPKMKYKSYKRDLNGIVKNQLLDQIIDVENHKTYHERNFEISRCNEKWTTDVSEFHIVAIKLYLSPILDMHNCEIISYSISKIPSYKQIIEMLSYTFKRNTKLKGLIFHSYQGWQYQMKDYHKQLNEKEIIQSMSRKGNCLDNSLMENFFGIMKREMFYGHEHEYQTLDQLKNAMEEYIMYYNAKRITTKLKGMTPGQYRNHPLKSMNV